MPHRQWERQDELDSRPALKAQWSGSLGSKTILHNFCSDGAAGFAENSCFSLEQARTPKALQSKGKPVKICAMARGRPCFYKATGKEITKPGKVPVIYDD